MLNTVIPLKIIQIIKYLYTTSYLFDFQEIRPQIQISAKPVAIKITRVEAVARSCNYKKEEFQTWVRDKVPRSEVNLSPISGLQIPL